MYIYHFHLTDFSKLQFDQATLLITVQDANDNSPVFIKTNFIAGNFASIFLCNIYLIQFLLSLKGTNDFVKNFNTKIRMLQIDLELIIIKYFVRNFEIIQNLS